MTSEPRADESFAAAVVRQVLNVEVLPFEHRDEHPRPVDFEVVYPDGRRAPLEVTWLATSGGRALDDQLARMCHQLPHHGEHNWFAEVHTAAELRRLSENYRHLIDVLDSFRAHTWEDLPPWIAVSDPDVAWLTRSGATLTRGSDANGPHPVYILAGSISAVWDDQTDVITPAVDDVLTGSENVRSHVRKLLEHAGHEHHLFLLADLDGLAPAAMMELHDVSSPPAGTPQVPDGLSHLWLLPRFGRAVLLWTKGGWQVYPLRASEVGSSE